MSEWECDDNPSVYKVMQHDAVAKLAAVESELASVKYDRDLLMRDNARLNAVIDDQLKELVNLRIKVGAVLLIVKE